MSKVKSEVPAGPAKEFKMIQVRIQADLQDRIKEISAANSMSMQEFFAQALAHEVDRITQCKPLPVASPETIYIELQRVSQALADLEREQRAVGAQVGILVQAFADPASIV